MSSRQTDGKRKRVDIDLTEDDNVDSSQPAPKRTANNTAQSAYNTPPASSAPHSSQHAYNPSSSLADLQHSQDERQSWLADEESDDVNDIVGSSQDDAIFSEDLRHYDDLATKIVGVQYYRGYANAGEHVLIRREPGNPYDSNAIRVDNVNATQIGHIPRRIAEKLAKYIDRGDLVCEGQLSGVIGNYDCPLNVRMFGPDPNSETGKTLTERMKADKLPIAAVKEAERREKAAEKARKDAEKQRQQEEKRRLAEARKAAAAAGKGGRVPSSSQDPQWAASQAQRDGSSQPVMDNILEASQRFNPRDVGATAEQYGMQEAALKDMPLAKQPEAIKTEMLPYQLQALQWLLDRESPKLPAAGSKQTVQCWQRHESKKDLFTNIATTYSTQNPTLASGGILADDMGLGKTLEMISLIVSDSAQSPGAGTTLIIAPLSVMSNWSDQIARHVHEKHALKVYTHHGSNRKPMGPKGFAEYNVVITTYQTLATEHKKTGTSGLFQTEWRRIILDEGHIVRNPSSRGAAAVTAVKAQSRWVLTGTPIVNSLRDLYSLLRFIRVSGGLEKLEVFNSVLVRPLKNGSQSATYLLQAIMQAFTLRRKKEMEFIDLKLPKLDEYVHRIDFTDKEKERYEVLEAEAKGMLTRFNRGDKKNVSVSHLLEVLLRMRQCCNHWQLCGERVTDLLAQLQKSKTVDLTPENKKALQDILQVQIESQEDCAICLESLHNPVITTCAHSFGRECIARVIETQHKCPMCRAELKDETVLVEPTNDCGDEEKDDEMDLTQSSSKVESMMKILEATKAKGDKTVVFSQWTKFLDIVQARLDREGYRYCRLDGTMSAAKRDAALHTLEDNADTTIMLASLGVCAVGLNLTAANQIILSDSWWAPAIEDQAVDRVHRLGQKKETRVFRLVMDNTIEESVLGIQAEKRKLMMLAFSEKTNKRDAAKEQGGRLADIQKLLA